MFAARIQFGHAVAVDAVVAEQGLDILDLIVVGGSELAHEILAVAKVFGVNDFLVTVYVNFELIHRCFIYITKKTLFFLLLKHSFEYVHESMMALI